MSLPASLHGPTQTPAKRAIAAGTSAAGAIRLTSGGSGVSSRQSRAAAAVAMGRQSSVPMMGAARGRGATVRPPVPMAPAAFGVRVRGYVTVTRPRPHHLSAPHDQVEHRGHPGAQTTMSALARDGADYAPRELR